jgi:hypothetical protein
MDINAGWFWGKLKSVGGDSIGHCEERKFICTCEWFWMVTEIELFESDLCTGVAKYTGVGGGIFEHLLWTVTNLSFKL